MRTVYRITYLSFEKGVHYAESLCPRQVERVDTRRIERVVESIHANFGFEGERGEWVAPSALLCVEAIGTTE